MPQGAWEEKRYHNGAVNPDAWVAVAIGGADLPETTVCIYVGTTGTSFTADTPHVTGIVFKNPPAGSVIWGRFRRVTAATTVADLVAGYLT